MMQRPPIVFMLGTQLRSDVLGPYAGKLAHTPHLDVLAQHAGVFERHFTTCPQGMPARASILTGLEPLTHGVTINGWTPREAPFGTLDDSHELFPAKLVDAGYRVVHVGIQHIRANPSLNEQLPGVEFLGPATPNQYHKQLRQRGLMIGDLHELRDPVIDYDNGQPFTFTASSTRTRVFPLRENLFLDRVIAKQAADVIDQHDDRPLALLVHFWLAHPPLWAPRKWMERHDPHTIELPPTVGKWIKNTPVNALANIPGQLGAHATEKTWREVWAAYLAMIELFDDCVGTVLRAIEKRGWFDAAMIALTADHGEMLGTRSLSQKMCCYEPAVRVPMMLKTPGKSRPHRVWDLTNHTDLAATILEAAQCKPSKNSSGQSLLPLARGEAQNPMRDAIYITYDGNAGRGYQQRMIRTRTHKFILHVTGETELYDLVDDPRELHNLAGRPDAQAITLELAAQLQAWRKKHNDPQSF